MAAAVTTTNATAGTVSKIQQQLAMNACGWCGEAPWTYSCAMCDPRRTKRVCDECAKRWHSRGFSQEHVLMNRAGETNEFRVWFRRFLDPSAALAAESNGSKEAFTARENGEQQKQQQQQPDDVQRPSLSREPSEFIEEQLVMGNSGEIPQDPTLLSGDNDTDKLLVSDTSDGLSVEADDSSATIDDDEMMTEEEESETQPHQEEKLLPLNALLAQFPSEEPRLVDMLSEYTNAAIRIQDGIACTRYTKCKQLPCTNIVKHFHHNANNDAPCDTECRIGLQLYQHMKGCSQPGCLFCLRVRLRKALNTIRAIEFNVVAQKKLMKRLLQEHKSGGSDVKAKYNFCITQVKDYERKRLQLIEDVEEMNTTVLDLRLPIFNFPRQSWHIQNEPIIKTEQIESLAPSSKGVVELKTVSAVESSPAGVVAEVLPPPRQPSAVVELINSSGEDQTSEMLVASGEDSSSDKNNNQSDNNGSTGLAGLGADYIRVLMNKKKSDPQAQQKFDESIELAYAIVEASFCSTSKATRCLLQCQKILDHLQHHLDLKVCEDIMCTTVEFHFAHLSMCSEERENQTCEYCLRVKEREFMRALDVMEGDLREAEAKAEAAINAMTTSFANDSREEREVAILQLEDELEQAEEYKRGMAKKLSTARMNLREVRERMEKFPEPVPTSAFKSLPIHFAKYTTSALKCEQPKFAVRVLFMLSLARSLYADPFGAACEQVKRKRVSAVRHIHLAVAVTVAATCLSPLRATMSDGGRSPRSKATSPTLSTTSSSSSSSRHGRSSLSTRSPRLNGRSTASSASASASSSSGVTLAAASRKLPLHPPPSAILEAGVLSRSASADTPSTHRNSARGHAYLSSGGVAAAAARRSGAAASAALMGSSYRGNHLMMDIDSARQSVDAASSGDFSRSTFSDSTSSFSSSGRYSSFAQGPQIPPDSTISAEDVIRESMASARSTAVYTDKDDFHMSSSSNRADSFAFSRSDSLAFSFSSRSTFRRSTISEQMLQETELFEPERELSVREVSEVLSAKDEDIKSIEVTSIKEEEEDVKLENAKSRWAQHVKLKARNFLFATMASKGNTNATSNASAAPSTPNQSSTSSSNSSASAHASAPPTTSTTVTTPSMAAAQAWANKQKIILAQLQPSDSLSFASGAAGAAKLQKWNRWMHNQYQNNIGKVMQRAFKEEFLIGQNAAPPNPQNLISIEEVVSNPRMMRYLAAWLPDVSDQSKLFFLCSFEEYRQFWCTLRANYQDKPAPAGHSVPFSKDDVLMLRTYGVKIAMKYLAKSAQFHIGSGLVDSELLRSIKRDLATGGEDALRTFDRVANKVKRVLMEKFPEFRKTDLYLEMQKSVEREVICLEDILMNHRFANFFWIFLFPHNYHREIALWLDIEYEFKPAYRYYLTLLKTPGRRKEKKDQAAYQCRKLLKYISQKYYPGDSEMTNLDKSLTTSCAKLQHEQDNIIAKFSLIHLELYHRFLTSRAYAEFSLYPRIAEGDESIDDSMRLSSLLLSYGLRAHHWPEGSRETQKKRSLEVLHSARGFEAICGVLTFEAMGVSASSSLSSSSSNGGDPTRSLLGGVELRVLQHPLPHDPTPHPIDKSIENFLVPWSDDPQNVVLTASTCPAPMAFNFRMGDSSSSTELFAACVIIYKPAPVLSVKQFEKLRLDAQGGSRWVPYGVCIVSKFPLVDLLRERLAEAYEFILELETIEAAKEKLVRAAAGSSSLSPPKSNKEPFSLDKKVLSKVARAVSLENISLYHQASVSSSSSSSVPSPASSSLAGSAAASSAAMLATLPRLDHSIRILFDTLDISTVLMVFTAALFESRILFISSYLSVLMKVSESLRALMYPLLWPHVYLPVLPKRMLQYLECPTPFIFGVEKSSLDEATLSELLNEDMLVVDLDKGCVLRGEIPCSLPEKMLYGLRDELYECLKPNVSKSDHVFANHFPTKPLVFPEIAVRSLFYKTVHNLIGDFGYHRYVWTDEYSKKKMVFFDEASYLAASSPDKREFLTLFIATQAFSEFMVSYHGFEDQIGATPFQTTPIA